MREAPRPMHARGRAKDTRKGRSIRPPSREASAENPLVGDIGTPIHLFFSTLLADHHAGHAAVTPFRFRLTRHAPGLV